MKLIGLISPNTTQETLVDVYKIFPAGVRIEGRTLEVGKYTDDEFHRAELAFQGLVRELAQLPLDFLMVTGELFLSYKGPGSDQEILGMVKEITSVPASTVLTAVTRGCRALGLAQAAVVDRVLQPGPEVADVFVDGAQALGVGDVVGNQIASPHRVTSCTSGRTR